MKRIAIFGGVVALLAGCATQQAVTLMPRGSGQPGTGTFDHIHQVLTVDLGGNRYSGTPVTQTARTSASIFTAGSTTTSNTDSVLLIGPAGQVRCDITWGAMKATAIGVCVDRNNVTYDLLIKN